MTKNHSYAAPEAEILELRVGGTLLQQSLDVLGIQDWETGEVDIIF